MYCELGFRSADLAKTQRQESRKNILTSSLLQAITCLRNNNNYRLKSIRQHQKKSMNFIIDIPEKFAQIIAKCKIILNQLETHNIEKY